MNDKIRLLIIEDSVDDSDLLLRHLKKAEIVPSTHRVETLASLREALSQPWHAIICDYNLPKFNALDALALAHEICPDIPCIVVSGSVGEERAIETMKAGASDYIMKDNLNRLVPVLHRELKESELRKERRAIEFNLKQSEENLRQSQKLESIGQLAGGIAHDFNNLLATILIQSEVMRSSLDPKLPVNELIEMIEKGVDQILKSAERGTNLTKQLLTFSRKQVLQLKVINLNTLILDMESMLRRVIEENIEFETRLAPTLDNMKVDPVHVEQILLNLIVNARDAMPKGGKLIIETGNALITQEQASRDNIGPGQYITLTITDSGGGMTDEVKRHLFEPFYTTKPVGKGTGLGLSTVYGIIQQNKGLIQVESQPQTGTTFKLFFPAAKDEVQVAPVISKTMTQASGHETILVVEDEEVLRELICSTLKTNGYKVLSALNGIEALQHARESAAKIDLVITDVVMPQMSGPELAKQLKRNNFDCRFLFQSGYTEDALNQHGFEEKNFHFLAKPYTLKTLLHHIRHILEA